jgi:predicted amidohydrolase
MKIGYLQFNPDFGQPEKNRDFIRKTLENTVADIIVLPELPVSGYFFSNKKEAFTLSEPIPGATTKMLQKISANTGTYFVSGILEKSNEDLYNSAVLTGPDGPLFTYRKTHLFYEEKKFFNPGKNYSIIEIKGVKIGILVCFDHLFPEAARTLALKGAQIICHPSNLVLPEIAQQTTRVRALENRVFWIMANRYGSETKEGKTHSYTGESQIIAPNGRIVHRAKPVGDELFLTEIDPADALNKNITELNNIFEDRRTDIYTLRI